MNCNFGECFETLIECLSIIFFFSITRHEFSDLRKKKECKRDSRREVVLLDMFQLCISCEFEISLKKYRYGLI